MSEHDEAVDCLDARQEPATDYAQEFLATSRVLFLGTDDSEGGEAS